MNPGPGGKPGGGLLISGRGMLPGGPGGMGGRPPNSDTTTGPCPANKKSSNWLIYLHSNIKAFKTFLLVTSCKINQDPLATIGKLQHLTRTVI
jgi:hypothetical protein